jgi:hypothetical protein
MNKRECNRSGCPQTNHLDKMNKNHLMIKDEYESLDDEYELLDDKLQMRVVYFIHYLILGCFLQEGL